MSLLEKDPHRKYPQLTPVGREEPVKLRQLPFEKGSVLTILKKVSDDWYFGSNASGEKGLIPVKFVSLSHKSQLALQKIKSVSSLSRLSSMPSGTLSPDPASLSRLQSQNSIPKLAPAPPIQNATVNIDEFAMKAREASGASYTECVAAVKSVLDTLESKLPPDMKGRIHIGDTLNFAPSSRRKSSVNVDMDEFKSLLKELYNHMRDAQNVNWSTADDSDWLTGKLEEMQELLSDADTKICRRAISFQNYEYTDTLLTYYQMDPRESVRKTLLITYGAMGSVDRQVFSHGLVMSLPTELARSIDYDCVPSEFLFYQLVFCTMLFSTGEALPRQCYDHWTVELLLKLLELVEDVNDSALSSHVSEAAFNVLLAFNLHQSAGDTIKADGVHSNQIVMDAVNRTDGCQLFSERLLLLVNRNEDPVVLPITPGDNHTDVPNSLLHMLRCLFGCRATASIFFTNDLRVLVDIILREMENSGPDSSSLQLWLDILLRIALNTDTGTEYRIADLRICLSDLLGHTLPEKMKATATTILEVLPVE
ncbi:hypothetical protein SARC_05291 [Sphaeroforma arctica JP610]|uniref:SH3 domain-containing protein n=1 Tax=Sphaeroforma arctica JP610 TaxID=667725 RepID=A0A0L0G026_9EUKA|nr:hypothetical protein SARC_05291 [Sphaeroforma arctica JP610]KNC82420.1 hypothetical protein SARC_05291 [Sphaeroforma arctica JP610]|eukprot:XP_014156322.1 hypothetical protein SARC_05291 [Sphaeroforma arctica JP610]